MPSLNILLIHDSLDTDPCITLKVPEKLQLYGLYVYYVVHICDFGMLRVNTTITYTAIYFSSFHWPFIWTLYYKHTALNSSVCIICLKAFTLCSQLCLSRIRMSQIIPYVEGLFKSSSLNILLFLTPHKSNFLQVEAISSVPTDST